MYKYIGIRGHRGAGKNTISYLIGVAIDYYLSHNHSFKGFDEQYLVACRRIKLDEEFINETDFERVYFDSFADIPKCMLSLLTSIPFDWMKDDFLKDSVFFNISNFEVCRCDDKESVEQFCNNHRVFTAEELAENDGMFGVDHLDSCWLSLRDLIVYFGKHVIQHSFGRAAWVNAHKVTDMKMESFFANDRRTVYRIFTDVKFPTEVSYITDHGGVIIKVDRPGNIKSDSELSNALKDDNRIDYEITIEDNVDSMQAQIEQIAKEIVSRN